LKLLELTLPLLLIPLLELPPLLEEVLDCASRLGAARNRSTATAKI
jgi:hypothetical protein